MNHTSGKDQLCTSFKSDPMKDFQSWVNDMSNKMPQRPILKLIKMRPEVFESLKKDIPI